jgi:hypothetical protein
VNGERRSFALLRPITDTHAQDAILDVILRAYEDYERLQHAEPIGPSISSKTLVGTLEQTRSLCEKGAPQRLTARQHCCYRYVGECVWPGGVRSAN